MTDFIFPQDFYCDDVGVWRLKKEKMTERKLKKCPFCGNEPTLIVRKGKNGWRDRYAVLCDYEHGGCGAESGWYHYEEETIKAWNCRVDNEKSGK